jgi:uncharacterized protein (DUF934 family)
MATLIKNKRIATDNWQRLEPAADGALPIIDSATLTGDWLVPLAVWNAQLAGRNASGARFGVLLENTDDPRVLVQDFDKLALIAVRFPKFTDGRGYSIARLLRRLGWQGELRAVGDVLRDQLFYMSRCGFDAFDLRTDQDAQAALSAFDDFSLSYQPAVDAGARFGMVNGGAQRLAQAISPW